MTAAECVLWAALRRRGLSGFKFNRQVEIGPYIVDFLCRERKLVVELDGDTHSELREVAADRHRTRFLEAKGYTVFRAWNSDVRENLSGVLDGLLLALERR